MAQSGDRKRKAIEKWEAQRKNGMARYVLIQGVSAWGGAMFVAMYLAPTLVKGQSIELSRLLLNVAVWIVAGAAFGGVMWKVSEASYRKAKQTD
jgi:hypothetical protein